VCGLRDGHTEGTGSRSLPIPHFSLFPVFLVSLCSQSLVVPGHSASLVSPLGLAGGQLALALAERPGTRSDREQDGPQANETPGVVKTVQEALSLHRSSDGETASKQQGPVNPGHFYEFYQRRRPPVDPPKGREPSPKPGYGCCVGADIDTGYSDPCSLPFSGRGTAKHTELQHTHTHTHTHTVECL
jgi:hypothetical protein